MEEHGNGNSIKFFQGCPWLPIVKEVPSTARYHRLVVTMGFTGVRFVSLCQQNRFEALRVLVPFVGMLFVIHLAEHDWHRFRDEWCLDAILGGHVIALS